MMVLDKLAAYNTILVTRKPCRGKGASGLLTIGSAEARKLISVGGGGGYDEDGAPKDGRVPAWVMEG
jgi:hypothetical protein